ncbi:hypothetical protein ACFOSC_02530 [Streptantibioticus rubrisoli]|uniref:Transposase n=1 Tax=Streptantibioticus rubrisoli TaxID=1387313 RepID=A0ABT1PL09_9ACTN|nr:hypothetical protein [Streptantibioticus rubrisoli]MCQ4046054.1 hypothetical protein [Streptantibioticus rubrisoli]
MLAALAVGRDADLLREKTSSKIDAGMLLEFVCTPSLGCRAGRPTARLAPHPPCTVGVRLFYLPRGSPELNDIKRI